MEKAIIILGAKGIGKVALDIFTANGLMVYGFLDEDETLHEQTIYDIPVLGDWEASEYLRVIKTDCEAFIATDEQSIREHLVEVLQKKCKKMPINAIHPTAWVSPTAQLGHGNFLNAQSIVNSGASIGHHCNIHAKALIDAEVVLGDFVQIGAGATLNTGVHVEKRAFIGTGVTIVEGVKIGEGARVGAGSVVVTDVAAGETVWGNPAKKV